MKNPFRKQKQLIDKKGFHNPCSHCWKLKCTKCLVFLLSDFARVLRSDKKLSKQFTQLYDRYHGNVVVSDRNEKVKLKHRNKSKKIH